MLQEHTRASPMMETLYRTYVAKKCAETTPGVGPRTDMFAVGGGGYLPLPEVMIRLFEDTREKADKAGSMIREAAWESTKDFLDRIMTRPPPAEPKKSEEET